MPAYPCSEREKRVAYSALRDLVADIFSRLMEPDDAALLAETLACADLRGVHSHGVLRVPEYLTRLTKGGVDPRGRPRVVKDSGAAIVVDGANSMGQIGATFAMERAIDRARSLHVAAAAVRGSNHCGALFYYARKALDAGMIGVATTNAMPTMAPWGGVEKIVGINPLAIAIPTAEEPPLVLDAAFSHSSHGKIRVYQQKGEPIPPTWAYDRNGRPTIDAAEAIYGLLQPIGEYKGVGLAMVMGILSSMLSAAAYGTELGDMTHGAKPGQDGHFLMAIDVGAFEDLGRFQARVDAAIRQMRNSRAVSGVARIYAPGGLEAAIEAENRRRGIPLNNTTLGLLAKAAQDAGVDITSIPLAQ
jgi:LDH2 family malate/lactate/ureidoglycolate dehydrogenase